MASHLVFFELDEESFKRKTDKPIGAISIEDNVVSLNGIQEFVDAWTPYFKQGLFTRYYASRYDEPLRAFGAKQSALPVMWYTDDDTVDMLLESIDGKVGETFDLEEPAQA